MKRTTVNVTGMPRHLRHFENCYRIFQILVGISSCLVVTIISEGAGKRDSDTDNAVSRPSFEKPYRTILDTMMVSGGVGELFDV